MKNKSEAKENLKKRLNIDHILNNTSIFHDPIGGQKLDEYTVNTIKYNLNLWFTTWVEEDINTLINKK